MNRFKAEAAKEADPEMVAVMALQAMGSNKVPTLGTSTSFGLLRAACYAAAACCAVNLLLLWRSRTSEPSKPHA